MYCILYLNYWTGQVSNKTTSVLGSPVQCECAALSWQDKVLL